MQLPMGTLREIKKAEQISSILNDLERTKFSGICHISSNTVSGTFVFKSGKCILAKILHKSGDEAWDELLKMSNYKVDAALSSLDEAQVRQALEFNMACRIIKAVNATPSAAPVYTNPQIPERLPQEPEKSTQTKDPPQDSSSFEKDIDTFDKLDIDNVTDKIRNDCKTIVKQLDLEHLMEQ
jgi:hypothetical protein